MGDHDRSNEQQKSELDPGAFIGRGGELASESIPGRGDVPEEERSWPEGHREGRPADDDAVREAGQNR